MWWQRWQKRATSRTSVPHFGHFSVCCAVADEDAADVAEAAGCDGAVAHEGDAGLSALFDASGASALTIGVLATGFSALFGAFATGFAVIGLSEVVPLMLEFYPGCGAECVSATRIRAALISCTKVQLESRNRPAFELM